MTQSGSRQHDATLLPDCRMVAGMTAGRPPAGLLEIEDSRAEKFGRKLGSTRQAGRPPSMVAPIVRQGRKARERDHKSWGLDGKRRRTQTAGV